VSLYPQLFVAPLCPVVVIDFVVTACCARVGAVETVEAVWLRAEYPIGPLCVRAGMQRVGQRPQRRHSPYYAARTGMFDAVTLLMRFVPWSVLVCDCRGVFCVQLGLACAVGCGVPLTAQPHACRHARTLVNGACWLAGVRSPSSAVPRGWPHGSGCRAETLPQTTTFTECRTLASSARQCSGRVMHVGVPSKCV
jgi:hypothetical protein